MGDPEDGRGAGVLIVVSKSTLNARVGQTYPPIGSTLQGVGNDGAEEYPVAFARCQAFPADY